MLVNPCSPNSNVGDCTSAVTPPRARPVEPNKSELILAAAELDFWMHVTARIPIVNAVEEGGVAASAFHFALFVKSDLFRSIAFAIDASGELAEADTLKRTTEFIAATARQTADT
jgi:hypothetical protein